MLASSFNACFSNDFIINSVNSQTTNAAKFRNSLTNA